MIIVGSDVPIGSYEITIKGIGADKNEHSCKYILDILKQDLPPPPPEIKIISPKKGDGIPVSTMVRGTFLGELPEGQYMWVVVNPHPSPGQWWPHRGRIVPREEYQWYVQVGLGQEKEDIGNKFDIAVILVNEEDDQYYRDYLKTGLETGSYPGIPLPDSASITDIITVTRK